MMTPLTLIIDRHFKGVGRLKKATGSTSPAVKRRLSAMLTELCQGGGRVAFCRLVSPGDALRSRTSGARPVAIKSYALGGPRLWA